MKDEPTQHKRSIRSYVIRSGRLDDKKKQLIAKLYPQYGIPITATKEDITILTSSWTKTHLEIGFGNGDSILHYSQIQSSDLHIGFEVYKVGIARILKKIDALNINNLKLINADVLEFIPTKFNDDSIASIRIFFPDPWTKKRHQKRRLVNAKFLANVARLLIPQGIIHFASDVEEYADEVIELLTKNNDLTLLDNKLPSTQEILQRRITTKFNSRASEAMRDSYDIIAQKL